MRFKSPLLCNTRAMKFWLCLPKKVFFYIFINKFSETEEIFAVFACMIKETKLLQCAKYRKISMKLMADFIFLNFNTYGEVLCFFYQSDEAKMRKVIMFVVFCG